MTIKSWLNTHSMQKRGELLDKWFEKAKGEVYVDVDPAYNYCDIMK